MRKMPEGPGPGVKLESSQLEKPSTMQRSFRKWIESKSTHVKIVQAPPYKYEKWVIKENSRWKMFWDLYAMVLVIFITLVVPYRLGFGLEDNDGLMIFGYFMDVCFLVDVILTFFQEAWVDAHLVKTHREIALCYLKSWLLLDLISIFPFDLAVGDTDSTLGDAPQSLRIARITKIYKMIRFVRLAKLTKAVRKMNSAHMKSALKLQAAKSRLVYFVCTLAILVHLMSCIFISFTQFQNDRNWLDIKVQALVDGGEEIAEDDYVAKYLISIYFVIQTITTVGYGDVNPSSSAERIYVIAVMLVGVITFGFISGGLSSLLQTLDE